MPFAFIFTMAAKDQNEASKLQFSWPTHFQLWDNIVTVFQSRDYMLIIAFINSAILTVASVTLMVVFGSMIAYVLDRRKSKLNPLVNTLVLAGLIIPPAVVPTIWVMQSLGIFTTLPGLILVEVVTGATETGVPGSITTASSLAEIMDDPQAYAAVMGAFRSVSPDLAREFTKRTAWLPNEPLIGGFTLITPAVKAEIESGLSALNTSRGH